MNIGQKKINILLIQGVDWLLLISVFSIGIYGVFYSENLNLMVTIYVIGLFLVHWFGAICLTKIAALRIDMEKQRKNYK